MTTGTAVAIAAPRLPMPAHAGVDAETWKVLTDAIFPNAKDPEKIVLAMSYCRARKLDIMKKPVNIVPMYSAAQKKMVETIWPSINETQVTAARTGEWGGMDAPEFGPDITQTFRGRRWDDGARDGRGGYVDTEVTLTFPESCAVTVYRIKGDKRCAFTEPVWWLEAYGRQGANSELPNAMWAKRPRGQLVKVAKATSLRAAFPEEGDGFDEAELGSISIAAPEPEQKVEGPRKISPSLPQEARAKIVDEEAEQKERVPDQRQPFELERKDDTAESWRLWRAYLMGYVSTAESADEINSWCTANSTHFKALEQQHPESHANLIDEIKVELDKREPDDGGS